MHILFEFAGAVGLLIAGAMLWAARPVEGKPALFLRKKERYEVGYALLVLFTAAGGFAGVILGFTT